MARYALLIGVTEYSNTAEFHPFLVPKEDVERLGGILRTRGDFEAIEAIDKDFNDLNNGVIDLFSRREFDDTVLIYYSGHGFKNSAGDLFLATKNSTEQKPHHESFSARRLRELMDSCGAGTQIVILDCCYSGAFDPNRSGGRSTSGDLRVSGDTFIPERKLSAPSSAGEDSEYFVFMATDRYETAPTGEQKFVEDRQASHYTDILCKGLSGEAAPNLELVSVDDLEMFIKRQANRHLNIHPRVNKSAGGSPWVVRNPRSARNSLPPPLLDAWENGTDPLARIGAAWSLAKLAIKDNSSTAQAVQEILAAKLDGAGHERDVDVRAAIGFALESLSPATAQEGDVIARLQTLQLELRTKKIDFDATRAQLQVANANLIKSQREIRTITSALERANDARNLSEQEKERLRGDIAEKDKHIEELTPNIAELQTQSDELKKELSQLWETLADTTNKLKDALLEVFHFRDVRSENVMLKQKIADLEGVIKRHVAEAEAAKDQYSKVAYQLQDALKIKADLEASVLTSRWSRSAVYLPLLLLAVVLPFVGYEHYPELVAVYNGGGNAGAQGEQHPPAFEAPLTRPAIPLASPPTSVAPAAPNSDSDSKGSQPASPADPVPSTVNSSSPTNAQLIGIDDTQNVSFVKFWLGKVRAIENDALMIRGALETPVGGSARPSGVDYFLAFLGHKNDVLRQGTKEILYGYFTVMQSETPDNLDPLVGGLLRGLISPDYYLNTLASKLGTPVFTFNVLDVMIRAKCKMSPSSLRRAETAIDSGFDSWLSRTQGKAAEFRNADCSSSQDTAMTPASTKTP